MLFKINFFNALFVFKNEYMRVYTNIHIIYKYIKSVIMIEGYEKSILDDKPIVG